MHCKNNQRNNLSSQTLRLRERYPTGNDNAGHNRDESEVSEATLPLESDEASEHRREKRRRCTDGLVKGDGKVAEWDVASDDREWEDESQWRYVEELHAWPKGLHWHNFEACYGNVAEDGARQHVTQRQEYWVAVAVVAEKVLVQ